MAQCRGGGRDWKQTIGESAHIDAVNLFLFRSCVSPRYSPQTSICVYRANDSDYSLASGANNKGVFDIFRSQVYDPVGGRYIANNYVEVGPCDVSCEGHMMIT